MATTTNYGWTTPDDTDLVKDGAAAIRTLGSSVDTTTKALNPSTTTGDIEYRSATANTNARLALGTAGQVLTVNSGATAPEWASPASGGGMTLINTGGTALTGGTTSISTIPGTYNELIIYMVDFAITADSNIYLGFNADNTASNYQQFVNRGTGSTDNSYVTNSDARIDLTGYAIDAGDQNNISVISIPNYASTIRKIVNVQSAFIQTSTAKAVTNNTTHYQTTSAITALDFVVSGTTWSGGTVYVYGVK
jgi:hypothetical protein